MSELTLHWEVTGGRDLAVQDLECKCVRWPEMLPSLAHCKKKLRVIGYNDANFFDNVKTTPAKCAKCGFSAEVTWHRDGRAVVVVAE
jgi:hypothetical protein